MIELETPSCIALFAQVMEPLATEPPVVLASASPIVGELLGEYRITVCHSATRSSGLGECRHRTGGRPSNAKPDRHSNCARAARNRLGGRSSLSAVGLALPTRTVEHARLATTRCWNRPTRKRGSGEPLTQIGVAESEVTRTRAHQQLAEVAPHEDLPERLAAVAEPLWTGGDVLLEVLRDHPQCR
jgi:hypothetical protein